MPLVGRQRKRPATSAVALQVDLMNKLGPFAWLAAAVAFVETLVCVKVWP